MNSGYVTFKNQSKRDEYFNYYDDALDKLDIKFKEEYVTVTIGQTHVLLCGDKENEPLLLFHGQGYSSLCWFYMLEDLSKKYYVIAIDSMCEPGKSLCTRTKMSLYDYNNWILELYKKLDIEKAVIMGYSYGANIAFNFAKENREKVSDLILLSPLGIFDEVNPVFDKMIKGMIKFPTGILVRRFIKYLSTEKKVDFNNIAYRQFELGLKYFAGWSTKKEINFYSEDELKELDLKMLLIIGEKDPIYVRDGDNIADMLDIKVPCITGKVIDGCGHGIIMDKPLEVISIIKKYINSNELVSA